MPYRNLARQRQTYERNWPLAIGLAAVLAFFVVSGYLSYRNARFLTLDAEQVAHTHEVITSLGDVLSVMKDAETGQRGFIITGNVRYLEPFNVARATIKDQLDRAENFLKDNPEQDAILQSIRLRVAEKFAELEETIALRRSAGFEAARDLVVSDNGRLAMDSIRENIAQMRAAEVEVRKKRVAEMQEAYRTAIVSGLMTAALGIALSFAVSYLVRRTAAAQRRQEWLQRGRIDLAAAMSGDQKIQHLGENILDFLIKYLGAHAGALFVRGGDGFKRVAISGVPADGKMLLQFGENDGLLGQAAAENRAILVSDVPEGYLTIGSSFGQGKPRHLAIAVGAVDGAVNAVLELGFMNAFDDLTVEFLNQVSEPIGVAVKSADYRSHLQELLEETQRQSEELQTQSEELRVSNEELEEQSRALKESQSRLEQQQAELEQTNSQLEEQTRLLEIQKEDINRAKTEVQDKAEELERASQYKSEFLANMSHELRTPLNSSLILSKLLADNSESNLTAEQVKYAQTIHASGNDLLALINDILDLSKIEAGHMEVHPEPVSITRMITDLRRVFDPVAKQRGLQFETEVAPDCPEIFETDRQRFEQILKNLLSNAFKFTERGGVRFSVTKVGEELGFAVTDSGIGIAPENQRAIFEAFHQADGTISRKFGGTGLGLSISRELARLLGGVIELQSEVQVGSTFTVRVPQTFRNEVAAPRTFEFVQPAPIEVTKKSEESALRVAATLVPDDRENLVANARTILVVEDDERFASLLYDMVREQNFQCLVANTAEDALIIARQYLPSAVLLDVGLPDHSGLSVLDRLKQDPRTRHIPFHIVSASDYSQTALSMGAVGYMLKPVKREDLVDALKHLEAKIAGGMRKVLIVEDDAVQRESLIKLLGTPDVQAEAVGTAAECLEKLKTANFDCMVLDLSLPDASGYSLLETLSTESAYSFPPVIVYTGRELSHNEEQRLRRYSKSIIIKGAKSPERLLDEVTLFLHQVVSDMPPEQQTMLKKARNRDAVLEGRRILIVEDDVRNVYSLSNILEPRGAVVQIARNGREALDALEKSTASGQEPIDLVLMDVMMPEMDGLTATREIRKRSEWRKLPVIMLTAKAMKNDQERCLEAGANDYMAKPLDVDKLLSLVRVWMPR